MLQLVLLICPVALSVVVEAVIPRTPVDKVAGHIEEQATCTCPAGSKDLDKDCSTLAGNGCMIHDDGMVLNVEFAKVPNPEKNRELMIDPHLHHLSEQDFLRAGSNMLLALQGSNLQVLLVASGLWYRNQRAAYLWGTKKPTAAHFALRSMPTLMCDATGGQY